MENGRNRLVGEFRPFRRISFSESPMKDVPLRKAIVAARGASPNSYPKVVKVFRHPPEVSEILQFEYTCGADHSGFRAATAKQQLQIIFEVKWVLMVCYKIPERIVHEALVAIPEYRRKMKHLGDRKWPKSVDRLT